LSIVAGGILAACGGEAPSATNPTPSPSASPSSTASPTETSPTPDTSPSPTECTPTDLCNPRSATATEESAMIAAGKAAFEKAYGLKDVSACGSGDDCFAVSNPSQATVGTNAGWFHGDEHQYPSGGGSGCWIYLYRHASGWHYLNGRCAEVTGYVPGPQDRVYVTTGCARVRDIPSLSGKVVDCLIKGVVVDVDSAPVFADGYIWWHLQGRGWMAHDFLIWPKGVN
jgi:hypothetical protein